MGQCFALVAIKEDDIAAFSLGLAQLEPEANTLDLACDLTAFQRVPGPPPSELFFAAPWTAAT
jgi:hypothetical protein